LAAHYCGLEETEENAGIAGHDFSNKARLSYMYGRAATIYGGSNEVQKNITAKYILGL
jgi:alkylation response protein AidB-like acyl-CoA dehydrogenase